MFNKIRNKKHALQDTAAVDLISILDSESTVAEQFRSLRSNIQFSMVGNNASVSLAITSSGPSEGKSTISANLAGVFSQSGKKTLLIDADMRRPTVWKTFKLSNRKGLSTALIFDDDELEDTIQKTNVNNLDIMTSGPKPPNPAELLDTTRMDEIIERLKNIYDVVIFDLPPIVTVTDAQIMAAKVDGTVLLARSNVSLKKDLIEAKNILQIANARILGVVFNDVSFEDSGSKYYYYYQGSDKNE